MKKNHIEAFYAKTPEEAVIIFKDLVRENSVVTAGGCMTSIELGIVEILRSGVYNYIDRERPGITPEEVQVVQRQAFTADYFITGTNA